MYSNILSVNTVWINVKVRDNFRFRVRVRIRLRIKLAILTAKQPRVRPANMLISTSFTLFYLSYSCSIESVEI